ncbi:MAG: TlpA disulfide reductase family protein [Calditrichia bacterium]
MKRTAILLLILFAATLLFAQEKSTEATEAPDFVLKDVNNKNFQLSDNLGKGPVVINFWATWCIPCIEEMKKMKNLYEEYSEKGVQFLAISVDDPKTAGRVKSFARSHRYPFTILLDTNNEVLRLYQGNVPPHTVLIDKKGNVVYSHVGYRLGDEKKLEEEIKKLLDKQS